MIVKFAVNDFLEDRKLQNLSPYTLNTYKRILRDFEQYCGSRDVLKVEDISRQTVKGFMAYCHNVLNNVPNTVNLKLRVLKAFVNYLIDEELYDAENKPFKKISFAKVDSRIEVFSADHLLQMLRYFEKESRNKPYHAYRNRIIIITLLSTGIRRGELANLRWVDIDFENSMIIVCGKKRMEDGIPITEKLRNELSDFYKYCYDFFDGDLSDYVFCSTKREALSPDSIGSIFKRLKSRFGWEDVRVSPHTFRHTYASHVVKSGMDSISLQRMLRHESLNMTLKYVNLWGTELREKNDKHNPLNKLDI
jgi:integrase/recombinase XerD